MQSHQSEGCTTLRAKRQTPIATLHSLEVRVFTGEDGDVSSLFYLLAQRGLMFVTIATAGSRLVVASMKHKSTTSSGEMLALLSEIILSLAKLT